MLPLLCRFLDHSIVRQLAGAVTGAFVALFLYEAYGFVARNVVAITWPKPVIEQAAAEPVDPLENIAGKAVELLEQGE